MAPHTERHQHPTSGTTRRPWNLGRLIGAKPPFNPKQIRAIRTCLRREGRTCNLALSNTAINSKLRGCDLVRLRVADAHLGDDLAPWPALILKLEPVMHLS